MRVASRMRHSRLASAAGLLGAALLLAPPPAAAGRGNWDDDDDWGGPQRRYDDHDGDHDHHDRHREPRGDWCPPRHARPYVYRYGPSWYTPRPHRARYYCEPCGHWYDDEASFYYHVHHHHHVAVALVPLVIMATVFGAVFAGGY